MATEKLNKLGALIGQAGSGAKMLYHHKSPRLSHWSTPPPGKTEIQSLDSSPRESFLYSPPPLLLSQDPGVPTFGCLLLTPVTSSLRSRNPGFQLQLKSQVSFSPPSHPKRTDTQWHVYLLFIHPSKKHHRPTTPLICPSGFPTPTDTSPSIIIQKCRKLS